ncbi:thioesterase [candidate division KSB3 bacterium]|uniref:Thioesterase n=1 Tax=candidate division KSB3 bacterium TaxID=2044937 RepID=A0A2G6E7H0_9BACT|nr:MAG: thioesterase [candidate division KSB3 bacterium]PIE30358.1 MAG: thioesterase [candidate division KSB3 bacterium]
MEDFQFIKTFHVRDYECDFQGIVNNSVYMNYLEHTRHEFAKTIGLDVVDLAERGINLVVIRAELEYKYPLRSGDTFFVGAAMERASRLRLVFHHRLYLENTEKLIMRAKIVLTPMNARGRPFWPDELKQFFEKLSNDAKVQETC